MNNTDTRRAIGTAMTERRTGKAQAAEINALVSQPRPRKQLKPEPPRGALPAQTSPGTTFPNPAAGGGGGGIASPLTEPSASAREYYPGGLVSSDGLFILPALKTLVLSDAVGAELIVNLADPAAAP